MSPTLLPYDIWRSIADFIPNDDLVKLYAVNLAFFHRAMMLRYGEIQISHLGDEETLRCVKNFGPTVAQFVKTLVMRPHALGYYMHHGASDFRGFISEAFWRVKGCVDGRAVPPGAAAARILLRDVSKMTNITSLKVIHLCTDTYPYFIMALPLVKGALEASGTRICELSLDIPVESYEHVLTPGLKLDSLQTLNITMHNQPLFLGKSDYAKHLAATLVPFIIRHRHTITHISIDVPYRLASVDLSSLFLGLRDRFPQLTSLSISVPLEYLQKPGFQIPLENHSDILEELKLICYPPFLRQDILLSPDALFALPLFQIPFPALRTLDLDLWMWPESERQSVIRSLTSYLHPIQNTLCTLILRHYLFSAADLRSIFDLSKRGFQRLFYLQICVRYLSVEIFDILSTCLSHLSRLYISFDTLGDQGSDLINSQNSYISNVHAFNAGMRSRLYSLWALQYLDLSLLGNAAGRWNECQKTTLNALPNVLSINGMAVES